jgi:hypothetical protein
VLGRFKMFQDFDPFEVFLRGRLEQACHIWRQCPQGMMAAILAANGFGAPDRPLMPGEALIVLQS